MTLRPLLPKVISLTLIVPVLYGFSFLPWQLVIILETVAVFTISSIMLASELDRPKNLRRRGAIMILTGYVIVTLTIGLIFYINSQPIVVSPPPGKTAMAGYFFTNVIL